MPVKEDGEKGVTESEIDGIMNSTHMSLSKLQKISEDRGAWRAAVHRFAKSWTRLNDSATATCQPSEN